MFCIQVNPRSKLLLDAIRQYAAQNHGHYKYVTGFTKTVLIGTRNEIQFIADY